MIAPTELHRYLVEERMADVRRRARPPLRRRRADGLVDREGADVALLLRPARDGDAGLLAQLAQLDGHDLPARGPRILAEARGRVIAAADVASGDIIADPFVPTAAAVALLRLRASQLRG